MRINTYFVDQITWCRTLATGGPSCVTSLFELYAERWRVGVLGLLGEHGFIRKLFGGFPYGLLWDPNQCI